MISGVSDCKNQCIHFYGVAKGDTVQIIVIEPEIQNKKFLNEKNKDIYKIPRGRYLAIKDSNGNLICDEQPLLSGAYTFHGGNKYHWTGIYADKLDSVNWGSYANWKKKKEADSKKISCKICGKRFLPYADSIDKCPDCYVLYECMINKDNENMTVGELRNKINAVIGRKEKPENEEKEQ